MAKMQQTAESLIARLFRMSEETWARHANPWSVYTRTTALPLLTLAIWSRQWFNWWCLVGVGAALVWIWFNPRIFRRPHATDNWASKGVFGERVWLARKTLPVPDHHRVMPHILSAGSGIGLLFLVWGLWRLELWAALAGNVVVIASKLWFLDRMVWIYEDMKDADATYKSWVYRDRDG